MLSLLALPTALVVLIATTMSESRPIIPLSRRDLIRSDTAGGQQRLLISPSRSSLTSVPPQHVTSHQHFDARENSIGVLFTHGAARSPLHLWLPLGKRVYTRDAPILPLHPLTARVTTVITSTPHLAKPEEIERIQCEIWTTTTSEPTLQRPRKVTFSRREGLVQLTLGKEVESYECHS